MKDIVRKLVPKGIRSWRMIYLTYGTDINRYRKVIVKDSKNRDNYIARITEIYHVLEKGLTMPETRLGFGENQIIELYELLKKYIKLNFDITIFEINYAIKVLNEYVDFHNRHNYKLKDEIINKIEEIKKSLNCYECSQQLHFTRESFTKSFSSHFSEFSQSRHSVRNYSSEKIPIEELIDSVKLAQNAPSSCNRQPVRVYILREPSLIREVLDLQGGNRGFGHLSTSVLVITANISSFKNLLERWQPAINAGFFGMALLYALHSKKIGATTLNWSKETSLDNKLRKLLNIPINEQVQYLVSCGYPVKDFKVPASPRKDVNTICKIIEER